ncbi:hypothetical protein [Streptomyces sp. NPDC058665]|uniref:hypothetical protein n=1 Tax=Streptomyces sp. NPDC058665 TaxID=3346586 RepID=UPI00364D9D1E
MSRETDSSSSGPQGRGGAAYPSGTPPYGSRQYPSLHPEQDAPEETDTAPAQPDEPKTETTLTTRIRINIPGSRPIPPVVMRTPMSDTDSGPSGPGGPAGPDARPGRGADDTGGVKRSGAAPETGAADEDAPAEKPATSDWFAPRKPSAGGTLPGGMGAGAAVTAPGPTVPPPAPGPGMGPGASGRTDLPYGSDSGPDTRGGAGVPRPPASGGNAFMPPGRGGATPAFGTGAPDGPTSGPASGTSSLAFLDLPPGADLGASGGPTGPGSPAGPARRDDRDDRGGAPRMSDDTAILTPQQPAPEPPGGAGAHVSGDTLSSGIPVVPSDNRSPFPPAGSQTGAMPRADLSGARFQDGQLPPPPGPSGGPLSTRPSSQGGGNPDFSAPDFPGPPGPASTTPAGPGSGAPARTTSPPPKKKKGRSKLMAAGAGIVTLVAIAYGAGLLLNHSDVPKGTTVFGVDIGGGTRDDAVDKLDATLGERSTAPLQLTVGGKKEELGPDKAGLTFDSQATVRDAAGSDYNPVSVIGSLFGGERVTEPVIPVDEEKLRVALTDLAGDSGSAADGTIKFEPGKAVPVPGKAGKALDVERSMISVRDAYRAQVETGKPNSVELPIATREPTIDQAELDRAMKEFAEPAMSGLITIRAGGKQIQFGPDRSLPQILSMKPIDGKLVEVYDRAAIEQLLDGVFDGLTITKADGKEHPVSAADVAQAMQKPLLGKTPEERTAEIELDPQG